MGDQYLEKQILGQKRFGTPTLEVPLFYSKVKCNSVHNKKMEGGASQQEDYYYGLYCETLCSLTPTIFKGLRDYMLGF